MSNFKLSCFAQSGNCYKPALMLNLCKADWEPVFVDYFNGESRSEEFRELNPMGEAPVLTHGDIVLTQSGVILNYLAEQLGQFAPSSDAERHEMWRWILWDNHKLTSYIGTLRFLRRFANHEEGELTRFLESRAIAALKLLDRHLATHQFALGDRPTIADLSMCGYLYFTDELGFSLSSYTQVNRWLSDISKLSGWTHPYDLMPGHPLPDKDNAQPTKRLAD